MKRRWLVLTVTSMALICPGIIVRIQSKNRQLAKRAAAYPAQYSLGIIYHHALGVPRDDAEAVRWYHKSAKQGYPKAQYNLGYMYYYGYGAPQDRVEAIRLFHQAAAQGDAYARRAIECDRKGTSIDPGAGLMALE